MRKLFKILLWGFAVVLLVAVSLVIAVALLFDPNDYKDAIAAKLSEQTGREVSISGDLSLSLFPWLAVDTGAISMAAAPAFGPEPMLRIDSASAGVRLMPLFRGAIEVSTVTVSGLDVRLAVRGDGMTSWSDLSETLLADGQDTGSTPSQGSDFTIEGVVVDNASVIYTDSQAGSEYRLSGLGLQVDAVDLARPIPFKAGFDFSATPDALAGSATLAAVATINTQANEVMLADFVIDGQINTPDLATSQPFSFASDSISLDSAANSMLVAPGQFVFGPLSGQLNLSGSGPADPLALRGKLAVNRFAPGDVFAMLNTPPPVTTDPTVLSSVAFSSDLSVSFESVALTKAQLTLDDTTLTGSVGLENFARPEIRFELAGDTINLDRYLPPADAADVAEDAGDNLAESALPVDLIRDLNARGTVTFKTLTMGELPFEGLTLGLRVAADKARLSPIKATVMGGQYSGDVSIDASGKTPSLSLNETVSGLDIGALAALLWERDNIEGTFAGNFKLSGRGVTLSDVRRSLQGNVGFELSDGALNGRDVWHEIRAARALFKKEPAPAAPTPLRTEFSTLRGTAVVKDGIATNNDFFAELPFLQLTGAGDVDLGDATLDYGLKARVLERPEFLAGASAEELDAYTEAVIPLRVTGDLAAPTIRPDVAGMARRAAQDKIDAEKERLKRRLLDRLGVGKDDEEGEEKEEDEVEKRLRRLFDR